MKKLDISGKRFGELLAISPIVDKKFPHGKRHWLCECSCGKRKEITQRPLITGKIVSCGCKKYRTGKNHHNWNGCGDLSGRYFTALKHGAAERRLTFLISKEYIWELFIKQNKKCALTGKTLTLAESWRRESNATASLDRINSTRGYEEGNVQWVHKDINLIKRDLDQYYFIELCNMVTNNV